MKDALGHGSDSRGGGAPDAAHQQGVKNATRVPEVLDRASVKNAYETAVRLAAMAGEARPNFVNWGHVYHTPDGNFRLVAGFKDTGKSKYEDDNGRARRLPGNDTFHDLTAHVERVR